MTESNEIRNKIINNIDTACEFCEREFTHNELIEVLKSEDDVKKQICILKINEINSQEEADLLVFHLTEHHGIVREVCAQKLNEIILNGKYIKLFQNKYTTESVLKAVNDINPNICRTIIDCLPKLFENSNFKNYFLEMLYERFEFVFDELEKLKRSNWYTKKLFNLYWCLEALGAISVTVDKKLISVLERTCKFREYTIREKSAYVLTRIKNSNEQTEILKNLLREDENFYVKRYAKSF